MTESLRRFEELERDYKRLERLYSGVIITGEGEDSFQSPKDYFLNFFRCCFELKELLKDDYPTIKIEDKINESSFLNLAIDIANKKKHGGNIGKRTGKNIGEINTHIHLFNPDGSPNKTKLTIKIDNQVIDGLELVKDIISNRKEIISTTVSGK